MRILDLQCASCHEQLDEAECTECEFIICERCVERAQVIQCDECPYCQQQTMYTDASSGANYCGYCSTWFTELGDLGGK